MKPDSWTPPAWLSFVLLVGTTAYLMYYWAGHETVGRDIIGPIILMISGLIVCGMLEGISYLNGLKVKGETNQNLAPEANELLTRVTLDLVRMVELSLALPFSLGTVLGLGHKGGISPYFPIVAAVSIGAAVTIACLRLSASARELRARGLDRGLEGWNGIIYSNKEDPRIWVPKLGSIGYTLNFAHSRSWLVLALLVSPALIVAFLGLVAKQWS